MYDKQINATCMYIIYIDTLVQRLYNANQIAKLSLVWAIQISHS